MNRIQRFVFIHRRSLAAVAAGLAVFFALGAVRAEGEPVIVAARDLPSGHVLTDADLHTVRFSPGTVPGGVQQSDELTGRSLAGPVRAGEPLTDRRVVHAHALEGWGIESPALSTIRLADATALAAIRVGDRVDVVALDGESRPEVVARDATVAAVRSGGEVPSLTLVTSEDAALRLAATAVEMSLTVLTRPAGHL